ncbi:MAG: SpoIID/LytB domain-containing protein [Nitriliruptorales bacterium]|nr:SpoIID/LytB domain-containing protein [Nitriliruptorales bacterium]
MRRTVVAVVVAAMTMGLFAVPSAQAAPAFRTRVLDTKPNPRVVMRGRGWGHSVGMSQFGAYALARAGRGYREILKHYYRGTAVAQGSMPSSIRVGLHSAIVASDVKAVGGRVRWRVCGGGSCTTRIRQPRGTTWRVSLRSDGRYVLKDGGQRVWRGGAGKRLVAAFNPGAATDGTRVEAYNPNGPRRTYKWGVLEYSTNSTAAGSMFMVLDIPSIELYLRGLGEVPSSWGANGGMAALKVQATAGRTYALRLHRAYSGNRPDCRCSLLATPANQAYTGYDKETESYGSYWVKAVDRTARIVVTYNGSLISTYYSSSHGGRSENVQDSWAFGTSPVPYLRSVDDPWSLRAPGNTFASWERSVTNRSFASFVGGVGRIRRIRISGRTDGGTPRNLVVRGLKNGEAVKTTRTGPKGIVGIALRNRYSYPARGLSTLPSQQIRRIGFPPFLDDDGSRHEYAIVFAKRARIMNGVSSTRFRPGRAVKRGYGAQYLFRTFKIPRAPTGKDYFASDDGHPAETAINALAHAGVIRGKDFKPGRRLSRATLAVHLHRLTGVRRVSRDYFNDDNGHRLEASINAVAAKGFMTGCGGQRFCPGRAVKRGVMASTLLATVEHYR